MNEFFTNTIESMGYAGVVPLMLLENIVPPVPSEMVMPNNEIEMQARNCQ